MDQQGFARLRQNRQILYMLEAGVCVADKTGSLTLSFLYQLPNFYVEVEHCRSSYHIIRINPFSSIEHLDAFLDGINLSDLLN